MQVTRQRTVVRMWFGFFETRAWFKLFLRLENTCISYSVYSTSLVNLHFVPLMYYYT